MNKYQKSVLINFVIVIVLTTAAVVAMVNFKDWVNRSEATRAMEQLGKTVFQYRKDRGSVPPESYVDSIKEQLEGHARFGELNYRARWLSFDSPPDEILAYIETKYSLSFLEDGFIVLTMDGRVTWMDKQTFETTLPRQQSPMERQIQHK